MLHGGSGAVESSVHLCEYLIMASTFKPPSNFDFHQPSTWKEWRERFKRFRIASKLSKEDGEIQVASFIYSMGPEAEGIFAQFDLNDNDRKDFAKVCEQFDNHFIPKKNVIHERATFHRRNQKEGESIEEYLRALYEHSDLCDFPNKDDTIRDRLVIGIIDQELSEKMQLEPDLTLEKAITMARQREQIRTQIAQQREERASVDYTSKRQSYDRRNTQFKDRPPQNSPPYRAPPSSPRHSRSNRHSDYMTPLETDKDPIIQSRFRDVPMIQDCSNCPYKHEMGKCPARGRKCYKCDKYNHFASLCRSRPKKSGKIDEIDERYDTDSIKEEIIYDESNEKDTVKYFISSIDTNEPEWRVNIKVCGRDMNFKIDTGADVNVISKKSYLKLKNRPQLQDTKAILQGPGSRLKVLGQFETFNDEVPMMIFVIESDTDNLLSRSTAVEMNLIQRVNEIFARVNCPPVKIKLKENAKPYSITVARRVPIPLMDKVKKELQRMKEQGVIEEITEATEWVSPMIPVLKPTGEVRICVDLKKLNQAIERERFVIPTVDCIIHKLRDSKVFSKLDAKSGFHQIPLDPSSAKLTTFITPFGRFYFNRLPFGVSSAPEIYQRTMEDILGGIDGVICYFDDILIHSKTHKEHEALLQQVLHKLREVGLQLNDQKCEFRKTEITFLGHIINEHGIRPDPSKIEAIHDLPEPQNINDLRRYLGMVNYLGRYLPNLSSTLSPLNSLLAKDVTWTWGPEQSKSFNDVKKLLTSAPTLAYYDPNKPTVVEADSSSYGLGGVILQESNGHLRPVAFCSRTLTKTEQRYAQIEKECLASVWACERFDRYLVGLDSFELRTDHKPLIPLMNSKDLSDTPLRCQRMLMRLMRYNARAVYCPGKTMLISDTLSRSPLKTCENAIVKSESSIQQYVNLISSAWPVSDEKLTQIRALTQEDVNLKHALQYTIQGWPEYKEDVTLAAREYFGIRSELSVQEGLLIRGDRIVIPYAMRLEVLKHIHSGHLGIEKCRERAKMSVWWPGISSEIKDMVSRCKFCIEKRPTQTREPLIPSTLPNKPFEKIGADLCEFKGQQFLVMVDYYSRYIDLCYLPKAKSFDVICRMKNTFSHHGIPNIVVTDGGPQFTSHEFKKFSKEWGFTHETSSPHYHQSNGAAERAVKQAKEILKQSDIWLALLAYRSTPIPELGYSPAELAFNRRLRTTVPTLPETLNQPPIDKNAFRERDEQFKQRQKLNYDRHRGVKPLPVLRKDEQVLIKLDGEKSWHTPARIVDQYSPRSYTVQTNDGRRLRRNRKFLQQTPFYDNEPKQQPEGPYYIPPTPSPRALFHQQSSTPPDNTSGPTVSERETTPMRQSASPMKQPSDNTVDQPYRTRYGRAVIRPPRYND